MDGVLIINKEKDYTSHDIVAITKKKLQKKVGHTGTLDPNATGVLPLLIGKGTQISKYLINHDKIYEATLQLGIETDTQDSQGNIVQQQPVQKYTQEEIKNVLQSLIGEQQQIPPMYSAIKINGKKLYEYARKGQTVQIDSRKITIHSIELKKYKDNEIIFEVACSKGTYIRTLCVQIAEKLKTIGNMKELHRKQVGNFNEISSITIEDIKNQEKEWLEGKIISIEELFEDKEKIILEEDKETPFLNGVKLNFNKENMVCRIYTHENKFLGLGIITDKKLKRDVVI